MSELSEQIRCSWCEFDGMKMEGDSANGFYYRCPCCRYRSPLGYSPERAREYVITPKMQNVASRKTYIKAPRLINQANKKNIYCDHCEHYAKNDSRPFCKLTGVEKNYWNRCKRFAWSRQGKYMPTMEDNRADE